MDLGNGIENIDVNAFNFCNALDEVHIGNMSVWFNINFGNKQANPLSNQADLYANGTLVVDLVIPDYVTNIKDFAFIGCTSLESVTAYGTLKTIGMQAFAECYNLKKVKLDNSSLVTVMKYAFNDCTALEELHITDIAKWCATNFENGYSNPLQYTGKFYINNLPITTLVIPDGVTTIGMYTFYGYTDLVDVIIPETVTTIDNYAFDKCTSLETVYYKEELEKWKNIKIRSSGNTYLLNADLISLKDPIPEGDINGDRKVNSKDTVIMKKGLLGINEVSAEEITVYDLNTDTKFNILDLIYLKKLISNA